MEGGGETSPEWSGVDAGFWSVELAAIIGEELARLGEGATEV